jgi:ABC-type polysaccharide/polyol phosphate transport system ATPase subunit
MSVVIEVQNLSKRFFLSKRGRTTFLEEWTSRAMDGLSYLLGRPRTDLHERRLHEFWALKDVSFDLYQGQTLGVIGENGAGKSTLLKILSRITLPTTGEVRVYGRLASLLEVGTGFHVDFSGRDNIYLNGAMLGLSRQEIRNRFDRIVEFSELAEFIDVPVKRYSTGMYVRLAFSVAAHLNPEVVILDEVLSVGDAAFQKKCLDRMAEIIREGHAAILVSHAMQVVRRSSQMCLWLKHGQVHMFGPTHEVVDCYEREAVEGIEAKQGALVAHFVSWKAESQSTDDPHVIPAGHAEVTFRFEVELATVVTNGQLEISFTNSQGLVLFSRYLPLQESLPGKIVVVLTLPSLPLSPGFYGIGCTISNEDGSSATIRGTPDLKITAERTIDRPGGVLSLPGSSVRLERVRSH